MSKSDDEERKTRLVVLGKAIASHRATKGMSQRALAEELGTGQGAVYEWETGRVSITAERLWAVADVLDCSLSELLATAETLEADLEDD